MYVFIIILCFDEFGTHLLKICGRSGSKNYYFCSFLIRMTLIIKKTMQKTGFATKIRSLFVFPVYLKNALEPVVCPVVLAKEARQHSAAEKKTAAVM